MTLDTSRLRLLPGWTRQEWFGSRTGALQPSNSGYTPARLLLLDHFIGLTGQTFLLTNIACDASDELTMMERFVEYVHANGLLRLRRRQYLKRLYSAAPQQFVVRNCTV